MDDSASDGEADARGYDADWARRATTAGVALGKAMLTKSAASTTSDSSINVDKMAHIRAMDKKFVAEVKELYPELEYYVGAIRSDDGTLDLRMLGAPFMRSFSDRDKASNQRSGDTVIEEEISVKSPPSNTNSPNGTLVKLRSKVRMVGKMMSAMAMQRSSADATASIAAMQVEVWRALATAAAARWILSGDYDALVRGQTNANARLSMATFARIRAEGRVRAQLGNGDGAAADELLALIAVSPLAKVESFMTNASTRMVLTGVVDARRSVASASGSRMELAAVLDDETACAALTPSVARLSAAARARVSAGLRTGFILGQFAQAECPAASLAPLFALALRDARAFHLSLFHQTVAIAGALGDKTTEGSPVLNASSGVLIAHALDALAVLVDDHYYNELGDGEGGYGTSTFNESVAGIDATSDAGVVSQEDTLHQWGATLRDEAQVCSKATKVHAKVTTEDGVIETIVDGAIEARRPYDKGDYIICGSRGN